MEMILGISVGGILLFGESKMPLFWSKKQSRCQELDLSEMSPMGRLVLDSSGAENICK